jgi:hypothetical protein
MPEPRRMRKLKRQTPLLRTNLFLDDHHVPAAHTAMAWPPYAPCTHSDVLAPIATQHARDSQHMRPALSA